MRLIEQLDIIKFICKEFWKEVFNKSIDNLKTNHKVCVRNSSLLSLLALPGAVHSSRGACRCTGRLCFA
jgi:hypothetical protein